MTASDDTVQVGGGTLGAPAWQAFEHDSFDDIAIGEPVESPWIAAELILNECINAVSDMDDDSLRGWFSDELRGPYNDETGCHDWKNASDPDVYATLTLRIVDACLRGDLAGHRILTPDTASDTYYTIARVR